MFNLTKAEYAKACGVSTKTIDRRINDGTLKHGKHYKDMRGKNALRQLLRFNPDAILLPPEKR